MSTAYVRRVSLKPSLSDAEVAAYWKFTMEEAVPALQPLVAKTYAAWDMSTATQTFLREVTPELIRALSST